MNSALLPVGTRENSSYLDINEGDILKLISGEFATFIELRRTKWIGVVNGRRVLIPVFMRANTPYILEKTGKKDESLLPKIADPHKLKVGDLFAIKGGKETFMYIGDKIKGTGKKMIIGFDLSTQRVFNIDDRIDIITINIEEIKQKALNTKF